MVTMPSARFLVAVVGQTSMHGGSSQCWQPTGTNARCTSGYSPNSMSSTRRHWTPGGVAFACRHAAVHVWQPTQRRRSATIAQRVIDVPPRLRLRRRCPRRAQPPRGAAARDPRLGGAPRALARRRSCRPPRAIRTRTMSALDPVASVRSIDIADSEFMLGTPKSFVNGVAQWSNWPSISSVSGRMPCRSTARPRTRCCGVAISTGSPSPMPSSTRALRIDDHAAMALDVVGDLLDELHADVRAPRVLHAARGEEPERIVLRRAAGLHERAGPQRSEILPYRQRLVLRQLLVPPEHVVLVQPAAELHADALQALLVRQLEAQALRGERGEEVPLGAARRASSRARSPSTTRDRGLPCRP